MKSITLSLNLKLLFLFSHSKLDNGKSIQAGGKGPHLVLEFCNYTGNTQSYVDYRPCTDGNGMGGAADVCIQFSVSITVNNKQQ